MIVLDTNVLSELMHPRGSSVVRQLIRGNLTKFTAKPNHISARNCRLVILKRSPFLTIMGRNGKGDRYRSIPYLHLVGAKHSGS